jgi:hypothetical protein
VAELNVVRKKIMMTPLERAKSMLPNVPANVFDNFFAPLIINDIGWPFSSIYDSLNGTDWYRILYPFSLDSLSQLKWKLTSFFLNKDILYPGSYDDINLLIRNEICDMEALIGWFPKDSKLRLGRNKQLIKTTQRLPAPVVFAKTPHGIKLLDDHHRIAALFMLELHNTIPVDAWIGEP